MTPQEHETCVQRMLFALCLNGLCKESLATTGRPEEKHSHGNGQTFPTRLTAVQEHGASPCRTHTPTSPHFFDSMPRALWFQCHFDSCKRDSFSTRKRDGDNKAKAAHVRRVVLSPKPAKDAWELRRPVDTAAWQPPHNLAKVPLPFGPSLLELRSYTLRPVLCRCTQEIQPVQACLQASHSV